MNFHEGTIVIASEGPYDGATSVLVSHFISYAQPLETLQQIHRRLKKGAPFILVHISFA
ncbi:MAG: hypothetical protein JKX69_03900 [Rhodobacteraceae bacterium]|nr:hypothetical protein [Paracoccaceae bacterium]